MHSISPEVGDTRLLTHPSTTPLPTTMRRRSIEELQLPRLPLRPSAASMPRLSFTVERVSCPAAEVRVAARSGDAVAQPAKGRKPLEWATSDAVVTATRHRRGPAETSPTAAAAKAQTWPSDAIATATPAKPAKATSPYSRWQRKPPADQQQQQQQQHLVAGREASPVAQRLRKSRSDVHLQLPSIRPSRQPRAHAMQPRHHMHQVTLALALALALALTLTPTLALTLALTLTRRATPAPPRPAAARPSRPAPPCCRRHAAVSTLAPPQPRRRGRRL